jgi:hypothetical protein
MKYWLLFLFVSVSSFTYAQKSPAKFGEIPMEDMQMKSYAPDSSAAAVMLINYGEAYVNVMPTTVNLTYERHVRIKILNKNGLDWATTAVPLMKFGPDEEKVSNLKASTFNLVDGKIVETKMEKNAVFKEKFNKNTNLYKFTLPNVREGSVIDISYKIISDFYYIFPNWQFQFKIPVRHCEYWAMMPTMFTYEKYMQGYLGVDYNVKRTGTGNLEVNANHWLMKNVPAFKEEPFMTSEKDYVSKINFALSYYQFPGEPVHEILGTWAKLNQTLLERDGFGGTIKGSGFLKKEVEAITAGITDPTEKIKAIYNFMTQNFTWDGTEDFEADSELKKIYEQRKGTSGDLNLIMASMLRKADIQVDPVVLSTRDHGFVREQFPMERQFNYVVCLLRLPENKTMWLDATGKYLPMNVLPKKCLNGSGFVISEKNSGWISLESKTKARTVVSADFVLAATGELKGKINYIRDGYDAHNMRNAYHYEGEENYVKQALAKKSWSVEKTTFEGLKDPNVTAKEVHDVVISDHATVSADVIYINPFVTSQLESNPFVIEKRTYPVDFGTRTEKTYMLKLLLPEGYQVDELPQGKLLSLPDNAGRFLYNIVQNGNTITLTSSFQINKSLFVQDEYPYLKEFYSQVIAKQAEQIVLKKK